MSGWGTWLEKGKQLAADLDKQINESVGVEGAAGASPADATAAVLNDGWNEDFDDEDLDMGPTQAPALVSDGWNEEEEVVMENLQESKPPPEQESLFSPTALQSLAHEATAKVPAETPETPVTEEVPSFQEETAAVTDNHFAPAVPESQGEGWDDDLHVDSHDADEVPAKPVVESPPEKMEEVPLEADMPEPVVEPPAGIDDSAPPSNDELPTQEPVMEESTPTEEVPTPTAAEESPKELPDWADVTAIEPIGETSMDPAIKPPQIENDRMSPPEVPITEPPATETTVWIPEAPVEPTVAQTQQNDERLLQLQEEHQVAVALLESQVEDLQMQLRQREDQLTSKAEQFTTMQAMFESEKDELRQKIHDTKDEAKKRILKAKERVEAMEQRLLNASKSADEAGAQSEIIAALREEGEKLARKQSEMEKAVRSAKGETRELKELLTEEQTAKEKALEKIASLEADLKRTKEDLAAARKGESQVGKLEADLSSAREECERKATATLSLEQQVKELKAQSKELRMEVEEARKGAELESQLESKKLKKEHSDLLTDLETKLHTSEREATLREDALRHEVSELRKRWQDAVRRADALSMDVQQSTAPLLRQLESLERQSRARAAAWAELETKLRSDLENNVIENEKLTKDRNELKSTNHRFERLMKDRDEELNISKSKIEDQNAKLKQLETKLASAELERQQMKEKYEEIEKVANEGVSKVRSDMMQTVVESEERYRAQIESVEKELQAQRDVRAQLERQVEQLLESAGMMQMPEPTAVSEEKQMKLRSTQGQAEILASTLTGLDSDEEGESAAGDEEEAPVGLSSFAAMEELNQRLKGTTAELAALREQLAESERTRQSLMDELIETRQAREKLPLFEAKVRELTEENRQKELEIAGLRDDIAEVGHLYRSQLNALLEEKAASLSGSVNGDHKKSDTNDENPTEPAEQHQDEGTETS